jgi:hypothetical protein
VRLLAGVNDVIAFILELIMLAVLGWWGFAHGGSTLTSIALGLGAPLAAAVAWGAFAAPRARFTLPTSGVLAVKALIFGTAVAALVSLGHPAWAAAFAVVVVLNVALAVKR